MPNSYNGQTLRQADLAGEEIGSDFTNCTFEDEIEKLNFSFALFTTCTFNGTWKRCNFTSAEGTLPDPDDTDDCNFSTGSMDRAAYFVQRPARLVVTTTATDTFHPLDGIPDIPSNGNSSASLDIKKVDADGNDLTGAGDNDLVQIRTDKGLIDDWEVTLVNGVKSSSIISTKESTVATITFEAPGLVGASIQIQFAP